MKKKAVFLRTQLSNRSTDRVQPANQKIAVLYLHKQTEGRAGCGRYGGISGYGLIRRYYKMGRTYDVIRFSEWLPYHANLELIFTD